VTSKIERRLIGIVEVDSGLVMISDPAYVLPRAEEKRPGVDYSVVLRDASNKPAVQLDGQGVVLLANFGGDGPYPVFGEFEDGEFMRAIIEFGPLDGEDD
jgi:hypothetical protein